MFQMHNFFLMHIHCNLRRGQLGLGTLNVEEEPVLVEALAGIKVIFLVHQFFLLFALVRGQIVI